MSISEKNNTTSKVSGDTWERLFGIEQEEQDLIDKQVLKRQEQYQQEIKRRQSPTIFNNGRFGYDLHDDGTNHMGLMWDTINKMYCFDCKKEMMIDNEEKEVQ
jgi:glutaredoxin